MSLRGYGLMQLDNRGTSNRGKAFENPIYNQLGSVEVADQLRGLKFLQQQDWVDANRIGVFGHSYGGYMTLMMMMKSTARHRLVTLRYPLHRTIPWPSP